MITEWRKYVVKESYRYYRFHKDWLTFHGSKLVVSYSDMKNRTRDVLCAICGFLTVKRKCTNDHIDCVLKHSMGNFKRRNPRVKNITSNRDYFSDSMKRAIDQYEVNISGMIAMCVNKQQCTRLPPVHNSSHTLSSSNTKSSVWQQFVGFFK